MQKAALAKAYAEVETLAIALELRAAEVGLDGDLRSGLLYEARACRRRGRRPCAGARAAARRHTVALQSRDAAAAVYFCCCCRSRARSS